MEPNPFGDLIVSRPAARLRRWIWPTSLLAHFVLIAAFVIVPILGTDDLPTPSAAVRAFFVTPLAIAAPPPPPPPRAASRPAATLPVQALAARLTAPAEIPDEIPDPAALDLGIEGGAPGGVDGGVAGGVVGGIVGGLVASEPSAGTLRVVSFVTEPHKLRMVAPVYPEVARRAHVQGAVVLALVVDRRGRVADVSVVNTSSSLLNEAAIEAARQWVYAPTLVDGVPVRLRVQVTVTFSLSSSA
jgi:periplasmic protein TonB